MTETATMLLQELAELHKGLVMAHHTVAEVRANPALLAELSALTHPLGTMRVNLTDGDPTDRRVWVARYGAAAVGWLLRFPQFREGEPMAYIHVFVSPQHRRLGVGSALARAAAQMDGVTWRIFGWTAEALAFFRRVRESGVVTARMEVVDTMTPPVEPTP